MSKEEIIHQEPKEIAKYVINHTPIGLLNSSLESLKVLVNEQILNSPEILQVLNNYKENHLIPITVPNLKSKVLISPYNKDNDDYYYDQIQKTRFKLNNKYEPENIEPYEIKTDLFILICKRIDEYIKKYYTKDNLHYNVFHYDLMNKAQILISGKIFNLKNSWTGEWLSIWLLDIEHKNLEGDIKINTIYYEDGNVQFNFKKNFEEKLKGNDINSMVEQLMTFIEKDMNWSLDQIQFKQG